MFSLCKWLAIATATSVSFTAPLGAADLRQKLTAVDEFQLQLPADAQISPDGKRVVYVRQFNDSLTDARYSNLWIVNSDGSGAHALTTGNGYDGSARWSPDGSRLAYLAVVDGKLQIVVRSLASGEIKAVTNVDEAPGDISWAPDGKQIAFSALVPAERRKIAQLPVPPAGAKWAEPPLVHDRFLFRMTAMGYLKPGFRQLFVVPSAGGAVRQITSGDFHNGGIAVYPNLAAWSADGRHLIISINRHPESAFEPFDSEIYEIAVADGAMRALTRRYGPDNNPVVSPNGRWIAYSGYDDQRKMHQLSKVYVMNRDGSGSRPLSDAVELSALRDLKWAPDDSGVYFQYDHHGDTKLGFLSLAGKFRKLADNLSWGYYNYTGGYYSVSRTGAIALTVGNAANPADVAVLSKGKLRMLTSVNAEFLAHRRLGRVEELWYSSSKDQRKIQGWIIYPPDFDPAKKYPLILEIHGGPYENAGGDRFDLEKQVWAAMGYVVFFPNYRGSDSYGHEFVELLGDDYPGGELHDLNSGVDAVIAKGFIDPGNLFVVGGSAGGVSTCWMVAHTDRFRAAASLYPMVNFYSATLTTWIPFFTKWWFRGNPWDHAEEYMRRSPISYVGSVKTPTMLMTGELDFNTPLSEAIQFYQALKLRNVESVLVTVPAEGHFIFTRPSGHIAKMMYVGGWFDQHKSVAEVGE